jgi:hypothetical protein
LVGPEKVLSTGIDENLKRTEKYTLYEEGFPLFICWLFTLKFNLSKFFKRICLSTRDIE